MDKNFSILRSMPINIPIEYISFDKKLISELKKLDLLKPHKNCVHFLRINNNLDVLLRDRVKKEIEEAYFQYGQLLFLNEQYEDAAYYFNLGVEKFKDCQCIYQMGIIYYDGLECKCDPELGCSYMKVIIKMKDLPEAKHLIHAAAYNLGRAYYMGFGVKQSFEKALDWWLFAADDGNPAASVQAQTMLGYFYSSEDHFDIDKAIYWHSEACGNGSLQSQGVLGVINFLGIGKRVDLNTALVCLRNASERGDIYARGVLCYFYYSRQLFLNAVDLASKMITMGNNNIDSTNEAFRKGMAIAYFIYGRCLYFGFGVKSNSCLSQLLNNKSYLWNAEVTMYFRRLVGLGKI